MLSSVLFGTFDSGSVTVSTKLSGVNRDLVTVLKALIVLFIAAPALIRALFRLRTTGGGVGQQIAKGWNG